MWTATHFVITHPLVAYFALTYAFSWGLWLLVQPIYLRGHVAAAPFLMLGIFAPALSGILLSKVLRPGWRRGDRDAAVRTAFVVWMGALLLFAVDQVGNEGRAVSLALFVTSAAAALLPASVVMAALYSSPGVREHLRTLVKPDGNFGYHALALLAFPAIWGGGIILTRALGLPVPGPRTSLAGAALAVAILVDLLYPLLYTGLSEEPGWRGFALPRLQARFSPLVSSLLLGVFWAVWHAQARFGGIEAKTVVDTLAEWTFIVLVAILFTWLYNRTNASLFATVLLHVSMNATSHFLPMTIGAIGLLGLCVTLAIVTDKMWRRITVATPATPVREVNDVQTTIPAPGGRRGESLVRQARKATESN